MSPHLLLPFRVTVTNRILVSRHWSHLDRYWNGLGDRILSRMVKAVSGIAGLGFGVRAQPVLLVSALVKTVLGLIVGRSALSPPLTRFRLIWR